MLSQLTSIDQMRGVTISNFEAMEQTRMPAHILAQNNDPKFQLSHGPEQWVNEWVNAFSKLHVDDWVEEFGQHVDENSADNWANVYDEMWEELNSQRRKRVNFTRQ